MAHLSAGQISEREDNIWLGGLSSKGQGMEEGCWLGEWEGGREVSWDPHRVGGGKPGGYNTTLPSPLSTGCESHCSSVSLFLLCLLCM